MGWHLPSSPQCHSGPPFRRPGWKDGSCRAEQYLRLSCPSCRLSRPRPRPRVRLHSKLSVFPISRSSICRSLLFARACSSAVVRMVCPLLVVFSLESVPRSLPRSRMFTSKGASTFSVWVIWRQALVGLSMVTHSVVLSTSRQCVPTINGRVRSSAGVPVRKEDRAKLAVPSSSILTCDVRARAA